MIKTESPFLYPNVSSIPERSDSQRVSREGGSLQKSEFQNILEQAREPLKFSAHAFSRLKSRNIQLDEATLSKVRDAVDRAQAKGADETLVLTPEAALIVSVRNKTVITALERGSLAGNVFTNIDAAVVI